MGWDGIGFWDFGNWDLGFVIAAEELRGTVGVGGNEMEEVVVLAVFYLGV